MNEVGIEGIVIPDGVEQEGRQLKALRFSILLTPTIVDSQSSPARPHTANASPKIDLAVWPQKITDLLAGRGAVRIYLQFQTEKEPRTFTARISRHDARGFAAQRGLAQRTWQRAFPEGESAFAALREVLAEDSEARSARAGGTTDTKLASQSVYKYGGMDLTLEKCAAPDALLLGQFLHTLHLREFAQTLAAADNKSVGISDARESSFALGQLLDEARRRAVDTNERQEVLNGAAVAMRQRLNVYSTATTALRNGWGDALRGAIGPAESEIRAGLSDLDKLLEEGWLEKTRGEIKGPVILNECATAYERSAPERDAIKRAKEIARRRYTGLRSQPTLAKLVRLLVDVELVIDEGTLPFDAGTGLNEFGSVAVEIVADGNDSPTRLPSGIKELPTTRFRLRRSLSSAKSAQTFSPASRYEWPHPAGGSRSEFLPLIDGFLHMREQPGRFYLRTFDVALGLNAIAAAASERNAAKARGAESTSDRMAPLRSQGFELGDTHSPAEVAYDMLKTLELSKNNEPLYAEDLLMGFRVDIQRTVANGTGPGPWYSATARSMTFQGIPIQDGTHLFPAYEERDDGFVAATPRIGKEQNGVWIFPRQELFSWSGEPLALPATKDLPGNEEDPCPSPPPKEKERGLPIACLVPEEDLNIGVTYDFGPRGRDSAKRRDLIPALRLGDRYRFVLRACYGNGGGPRFDPSPQGELYEASALGATGLDAKASDKDPAPFITPDPVAAPGLALFADDPLVLAFSAEKDRPAEKYDQVVLRAEYRADRTARRILLPPRIAFEQAEIQGQFDRVDVPRGALVSMSLDPRQGALPQAVGGKIIVAGEAKHAGAHRGAVYMIAGGIRKHPYFCDTRGRCVVIALQRPGTTPDTSSDDVSPPLHNLRFWQQRQGPDDALPIVVDFKIAPLGATGARFVGQPEVRSYAPPGPSRALRVVVEVGLAEKIELRTWCIDERLLHNNLFVAGIVGIKSRKKPVKSAKMLGPLEAIESASKTLQDDDGKKLVGALLDAYGGRAPSTLSDSLTWSVVAATRRPLVAPSFVLENGQPVLSVRRLRAMKAEERWVDFPRADDDEPEGTQVFLDGNVEVHRRSAGELRVQLLWKDFNDQVAVERVRGQWEFNPRSHSAEKTISITLTEANANQPVALDVEAAAQAKRLAFEVGWQAVRIGVRLVSRTRFAHCYPSENSASASDLSPFEAESHPVREFLPPDGRAQGDLAIWLNATQRPPKPEVAEMVLVRRFREIARSSTAVVIEARWTLRLILRKGSWHQSGEGELLAVVLLPKDAVTSSRGAKPAPHHRLDEDELKWSDKLRRLNLVLSLVLPKPDEAKLTKLMQLVSGWAADPATDAGRLQPILSPGQFAGWVEKRAYLTLPFAMPQDGTPDVEELAKVAIIAYEPILDVATGDRYVDVDFLSPDIDSPFVRLSVARYQPHALDGLWLSSQVCLDPAELPPRRQVEVRWQGPGVLQVKITGPAYRRRALGAVEGPESNLERALLAREAYKTDVPWMRISIQRFNGEGAGFLAADGASVGLQREVAALVVGEQGLWETEFVLPATEKRWRVFIAEVEFHLPGVGATERKTLQTLPRGFKCEVDVDAQPPPRLGAPAPS